MIASNAKESFVLFLYKDIQWGSTETIVGINGGDNLHFYTPVYCPSVTPWVLDLTSPSGLYPEDIIWKTDITFEC